MLSIRIITEQRRCLGLFNSVQGRLLVSGKLRKRIIRIKKGAEMASFEIIGLNGVADVDTLRLVPQPLWRVRRLLKKKLRRLHPGYQNHKHKRHSLAEQWRDYNHLLGSRNLPLVGFDDWITNVEQPYLIHERNALPITAAGSVDQPSPLLPFAIWMWGDRRNDDYCERSLSSLDRQWPGSYQVLPAEQQLLGEDASTWVVFVQVGDELAPQALHRLAEVIQRNNSALVVYADEDRISLQGRRHTPQFKPAWNPDLLYSDPNYSHSWAVRSDICIRACKALQESDRPADLYAIALELSALCPVDQILHIPEILYHRLDRPGETAASVQTKDSLQAFLSRHCLDAVVNVTALGGHRIHWPLPDPAPLVSIIIPTRDQQELLRSCLTSLDQYNDSNPPSEVIIIDNGSQDRQTLAYLSQLEQRQDVTVLRVPGPFNYADLNNRAVSTARGEILALLNNDVEATHEGWLHTMAAQAMRPDIGAVGAKLLFEDGTIQHAGIIMGIGGIAGHAHKYMAAAENGYQSRLQLSHNVCAVTGAALVLRKSVFEQVSGFDSENLAVNYNDVDLCLRIMAAGYRNIFCADAVLIHHESKSRGAPVEPKAYRQWQAEREIMLSRWPHAIAADPHYSPHLSLLEEDLSISLKPASWQARRAILSDRQL